MAADEFKAVELVLAGFKECGERCLQALFKSGKAGGACGDSDLRQKTDFLLEGRELCRPQVEIAAYGAVGKQVKPRQLFLRVTDNGSDT